MSSDVDSAGGDDVESFISNEHETSTKPIDLCSSFFGQLLNPTDFKIIIGNFFFAVHKVLIGEKSRFFKELCSSRFREAQTNEVTLHDDFSVHVARMVCWMYAGAYSYGRHHPAPGTPNITMDQMMRGAYHGKDTQELDALLTTECDNPVTVVVDLEVYVMADKYDCPALRHHSASKMFDYVRLSDAEAAVWSVVSFIKDTALDTGPLKHQLCTFLFPRIRYFVEQPQFQDLIGDLPDVALQIFKEITIAQDKQSEKMKNISLADLARPGGKRRRY